MVLHLGSPGLARLVAQGAMALRQDTELRGIQSANAAVARYFDQPGVFSAQGGVGTPVTGAVVYQVQEAQSGNEKFSSMLLTFDAASGAGRFRIDGGQVTPTVGQAIPAGGITILLEGWVNIKNFRLIAEAGATLTFSRTLFL